ncbi:hypothetical protein CTI12_AA209560 [Artemisia annua]|uniref:Uncharacterized protein n=1 Tax=Artemisia annua TaxID=35608 RepID=A0A2U1NZM2_ARTAN|nr:hypothetical protein CTI12_AA209560 [Artemisia annua]
MAGRFPKCQKIAKKIGNRKIYKVLEEIFSREKKAYECDEREYNERIEEVEARVSFKRGIIVELEKYGFDPVVDEPVAVLKAAVEDDLGEIARLTQMSHLATLRAAEKSRVMKKMRIVA